MPHTGGSDGMTNYAAVSAGGWASRATAEGRERMGYVGEPPLFVSLHLPAEAHRAVLVCSPLYAEFMQNYSREVRLSRGLAAAGVASARFHYRGTGDSAGDPAEVAIDRMVEDALEVAHHLIAETGVSELDVVGTRLAGHVAAQVVQRLNPGSRLVVWEPVTDPGRYFDEVFRANRMVGVIAQNDATAGKQSMVEELRTAGRVDVVGYHVHRALYDSAVATPFPTHGLGKVFLIQASRSDRIKKNVQALADAIARDGGQADIAVVPPGEGWWIHNYDEDTSPDAAQDAVSRLVAVTTGWLAGDA